jgi:Xaa-Pro aminopeptidase
MIIVVEPILSEAGVGGVKLEDAVLVTADGAERLSSCPIRSW